MFAKTLGVRLWLLTVSLLVALTASQTHGSQEQPASAISLGEGEQKVLQFGSSLRRVAVSDPEVAAVSVTGSNEVIVTAKGQGSATLSVWQRGQSVPVTTPILVAASLGARLPFGTQVQTDIRVIEVNREKLNELGVFYSKLFTSSNFEVGFSAPETASPIPAFGRGLTANGFNLFRFGSNSLSVLRALESGGFAYTLAEPSLVSLSGQSATFLSGGEFPIPVRRNDDGIQVEFKEFGVSLSLTPTVVDGNQIILKVAPEVSDLDFNAGVTTGGVVIPGLRVRRTETTVSIAPGETFIISGLISRNTFNNSDQVPGLGRLPIVGALFRSDRVAQENKELIMVVTPHLVRAGERSGGRLDRIAQDYHRSSVDWLDMATGSQPADRPIKHGFSW